MRIFAPKLLISLIFAFLASCDSESNNTSDLTLSAPSFIQQARAIDPAELILTVTVNGTEVNMLRDGNEWTGTTRVPAGEFVDIELLWSVGSRDSSEPIKLAEYSNTTGPVTTDTLIQLNDDEYDTSSFNDDEDDLSNFAELEAGRNPSDPTDADNSATGNSETGTSEIGVSEDAVVEETIADASEPDVVITRVNSSISPVIDGEYEDVWDSANGATWADIEGNSLAINNLTLGDDSTRADGATEFQWVAMHDFTYLYLLLLGEQASGAPLFADSINPWDDDTMELYIDGDNSKSTSYDGINDYLLFIPLQKYQKPLEANNIYDSDHRKYAGSDLQASAPWPDGVEFVNHVSTEHRHSWEIRIELSKVGIEFDKPFGIDIHYTDDQGGGSRASKWSWKSERDDVWENPSLMGTAILQ